MDLPEVAQKIYAEEIDERMPLSESVTQKIGQSLNYLENQAETLGIGSIEASFLTEAQYQARRGMGYILADGRNVLGSAYYVITGNTTVPDLRGLFLRMHDHSAGVNPDGDTATGTFQDGLTRAHKHGVTTLTPATYFKAASSAYCAESGTTRKGLVNNTAANLAWASIYEGGTNSNPDCIIANWLIRIN